MLITVGFSDCTCRGFRLERDDASFSAYGTVSVSLLYMTFYTVYFLTAEAYNDEDGASPNGAFQLCTSTTSRGNAAAVNPNFARNCA